MAYDRHDPRDERSRWRDDDREFRGRERGDGGNERGFFERAGNQIASWFGDDDGAGRRPDQRSDGWGRDGSAFRGGGEHRDRGWGDQERQREGSYRPIAGDYGRSAAYGAGGMGRDERSRQRGEDWREREPQGRVERAGQARAGRGGEFDPHYHSWRQRQIEELDRDYEDYRREHQSKFESDFGSWRERRMQKRGLLGQIREHMEVVGKDDQHVGTIDRVAGERIILAKSDPDSGGTHHSLSGADVDRIDGERVVLDCSAEEAKQRWRDDSRDRALFEREDQGEMGDHALNRSFSGTYR